MTPRIAFVPFVPGWRPLDEEAHPGLGSSEDVAVDPVRVGGRRLFALAQIRRRLFG